MQNKNINNNNKDYQNKIYTNKHNNYKIKQKYYKMILIIKYNKSYFYKIKYIINQYNYNNLTYKLKHNNNKMIK